jgi:hypothetical protein
MNSNTLRQGAGSAGSRPVRTKAGLVRWLAAGVAVTAGLAGGETAVRLENVAINPARILVVVPGNVARNAEDGLVDSSTAISQAIAALKAPSVVASAVKHLALQNDPASAGSAREGVLANALRITREADAPVIAISADLPDETLAVNLSNYLSGTLLEAPHAEQAAPAAPVDTKAQAALAAFEQGEGARIAPHRDEIAANEVAMRDLDATVSATRKHLDEVGKARVSEVVAGKFPPDLATPRLESLLSDYAAQKAEYEGLTLKLGPLHPQLKAAVTELEASKASIATEIASITLTARQTLQTLVAKQSTLKTALTDQKAELASLEDRHAYLKAQLKALPVIDQSADAPVASAPPVRYRLISPATLAAPNAQGTLTDRMAGALLGLLAGAVILFSGRVARPNDPATARTEPKIAAKSAPRSILDQIVELEEMWPETGRKNMMPQASNDEPRQYEMRHARQAVTAMNALRAQAQQAAREASSATASQAANAASQASLEQVLADMQRLRTKVQWYAAEQQRQHRLSGSGRRG